jgi:peptidoglycan hydrolase-like protein with peptidoglycan-binding domain
MFYSAMLGRTIMPEGISPWPEVKSGANAHPIKTLQYLPWAYGQGVVVDGQFGPQTDAAVKAFQSSRGQAADGIVGPSPGRLLSLRSNRGARGGDQRRARGVPVP